MRHANDGNFSCPGDHPWQWVYYHFLRSILQNGVNVAAICLAQHYKQEEDLCLVSIFAPVPRAVIQLLYRFHYDTGSEEHRWFSLCKFVAMTSGIV